MKKIIFHLFTIVVYFSISACGSSTSFSSVEVTPSPSATNTPISSVTASPSPTSNTPEVPALVKTTLEFYRNGKTYEIIVGYAVGNAFSYATPRPKFPKEKWEKARANSAELKRYGDFDNDGETEFIVSLMYCGAYCSESIQVYEYDAKNDSYYVADKFGANLPAVKEYTDINKDGNPELITDNYGFCYQCSPYTVVFSAITILRYENGKFVDVTKDYPELIQQDADNFLESSKTNAGNQGGGFITLASYFYDMYRLNKTDEAIPVFDQICNSVVKPNMQNPDFTCAKYKSEVETAIHDFESKP